MHILINLFFSNLIFESVTEFILKMHFYITDLEGAFNQDTDIVGSWPTFATNYLCDLGLISLGLSGS